jgi:hypothetical protein
MPKATQPVSINDIEFDALISEDRTMEATVPEYSTEDGFSVSDAIILNSETLSMVLYVSNTPVTWYNLHGSDKSRVDTVTKQLEELYYKAEPVTIVTSDNTYTDMAIEGLSFSKSTETGYDREIPISFKKIRVTTAKTTSIPDSYGKSGATAASAGTASTSSASSSTDASTAAAVSSSSNSDTANKSSILYGAASKLGLI